MADRDPGAGLTEVMPPDRKWIVCTGCLRDRDTRVDTVKYCVECNENLCKRCLREHIKMTSSFKKGHTLLSGDELPARFTVATLRAGECSKCDKHPDNARTMYCSDHQSLVCGACIVLHHQSCENVVDTEAPLDDDMTEVNRDELIQAVRAARSDVEELVRTRRKDQSRVRKTTASSLSCVREFRKHVNKMFDNLEKKASDEINSHCIEHDDKIEHDIRTLEKQGRLLDLSSHNISQVKIDQANGENKTIDLENVLQSHSCNKVVQNSNAVCQDVRKRAKESVPQFIVNPSLTSYLKSLKSIGDLVHGTKHGNKEEIEIQTVKLFHDDERCCDTRTVSIAPFHSGKLLLTDSENCCIKVLNEHLSEVRCINLNDDDGNSEKSNNLCQEPYAACYINDGRIAVSVEQLKIVKIKRIEPDDYDYTDIFIGEICRGLRYNELYDELYVCCGGGSFLQEGLGHLDVFKISGVRIRTIKTNPSTKQPVFSCPLDVTISNTGSTIYVSDKQKGVLAFDRQGCLQATCTSGLLDEPRGICVDFNNHVIVCGHQSNNIIDVDENLEDSRVLIDNDRIHSPHSIAFLPVNSKFIVTMSNEGCALIFKRK